VKNNSAADDLVSVVMECRPTPTGTKGDAKLREFEMRWAVVDGNGDRLPFEASEWSLVDHQEFARKMLVALRKNGNPRPWKALRLATNMMLRSSAFRHMQPNTSLLELIEYVLDLPDPQRARSAPKNRAKYEKAIMYEAMHMHDRPTINQVAKFCGVSPHTVKRWRKEKHYGGEVLMSDCGPFERTFGTFPDNPGPDEWAEPPVVPKGVRKKNG